MLDWPTSFSDQVAYVITLVSFALAALSIVAAAFVIAHHALHSRKREKAKARKLELENMLRVSLDSSVGACDDKACLSEDDYAVLINFAIERLRTIIGEDAQRLVLLLRFWGILDYIDACLLDGSNSRKAEALIYCSYETTGKTRDYLIRFCEDDNPVIQLICLRGLALRGDIGPLIQALHKPSLQRLTNHFVLSDIFISLGNAGAPFLIQEVTEGKLSTEVRTACLIALGHMKNASAVPAILSLTGMAGINPDIHAQALLALGRIGDARAEGAILEGLRHPHLGVRVQSVHAAVCLGPARFVSALTPLLEDTAWWARFRAAEALFKAGEPGIQTLTKTAERLDDIGQTARSVLLEGGAARA